MSLFPPSGWQGQSGNRHLFQQSSGLSAAKQKGDHLHQTAAQSTEIMKTVNLSSLFQVTLVVVLCQQFYSNGLFKYVTLVTDVSSDTHFTRGSEVSSYWLLYVQQAM